MTKEDKTVEKKEDLKTEKKPKKLTKAQQIEELEKQVSELKNEVLRSRADYENFRKRKEQELIDSRDRAIVSFVLDVLPSIDNFEMSLKMTENQPMFVKGVEMIHKNLIDVLKEHKFEEFSARVGDEFDVHLHDPVLIEEPDATEGKVLAVLKSGYKRNEKVVRPVRVQIKKPDEEK